MFDDRTELDINKIIKKHNSSKKAKVPLMSDNKSEGEEMGREISKKVLKDFPEFPKNVDLDHDDVSEPKDVFISYCDAQLIKNKILAKMDGIYGKIPGFDLVEIWQFYEKGLVAGYEENWDQYSADKPTDPKIC